MGKMILDDLRKRLERLDEDADLMIDNDDRYQMVIVGGSAFILLGKLTRATHDIDALSVPKELYGLLGKYDINTDVEAYIDNFPYNFQDRLQPLPFGGTKVQFYTPSLEDLVIAKLCSFRDTDKADVESEAVRNSLDWNLLEHLATDEDELRASILNDWRYGDNAQSFRYRHGLRCSGWSGYPRPTPAYHSFRKTASLQGGLSVDPSCQPTSVNEDGWHCRSMDGRDGRKLPNGGSFISQSGSIISR